MEEVALTEAVEVPIDIRVKFKTDDDSAAMLVQKLNVQPGERLAVIAPEGLSNQGYLLFNQWADAVRRIMADAEIECVVFPYGTVLRVVNAESS